MIIESVEWALVFVQAHLFLVLVQTSTYDGHQLLVHSYRLITGNCLDLLTFDFQLHVHLKVVGYPDFSLELKCEGQHCFADEAPSDQTDS